MFNQGVAWALDYTKPAQLAQHAAHQRRLADPELAGERNDHAAAKSRRERRTGSQSGFRARQVALQRFYNRGFFHRAVRCSVPGMPATTVPRQVDLAAL